MLSKGTATIMMTIKVAHSIRLLFPILILDRAECVRSYKFDVPSAGDRVRWLADGSSHVDRAREMIWPVIAMTFLEVEHA